MADNLQEKLQATLGDAFTLERELGGGGMSRVFLAADTTLGRKVVVKMLPSETAAGVSVERFKREIQVVARLQHPHIVPVLSAGEIDGLPFYTMPYVKGDSLRTRLSRGGEMSVNEAIHLLRDVASALAYAHGEGVVHRDIKPDNVIVSGGVAVVTDFGVSKAVDVSVSDSGRAKTGITSFGIALGTPAYMSPEQASADPQVDHRADIYSFGCLAYELMAGSSPFGGRAPQQMLAAHVTEAPEHLTKRRPSVPPQFAALVMRCLEKRAGDRPQSADELLTMLDAIVTPSGGSPPTFERLTAAGRNNFKWIAVTAGVVAIVAVAALASGRFGAATPLTVGATLSVAATPELEGEPAISPDGKLVAFTSTTKSRSRIFLRQIDGSRATLLTGELDGDHVQPRWSPDGSRISFRRDGGGSAIYLVPALTGGSPKRTIDVGGGRGHTWTPDNKSIVYSAYDGLWIAGIDGSSPRRVIAGDNLHSPAVSPDGRLVAYGRGLAPTFSNVSMNTLWVVPLAGGEPVRFSDSTHMNTSPQWLPDGKSLLYVSGRGGGRDVFQQPVNSSGRPRGEPRRVTTALSSYTISLSADGARMAYDVIRNFSNIWMAPIGSRETPMSSARQVTRENQHVEQLDVSLDGKWLVYDTDRGGNFDIYRIRVDGGEPVQVTTNSANEFGPAFSADGESIAYYSPRAGTRDLYVSTSEGTSEQRVTAEQTEDWAASWSPDGKSLVYHATKDTTSGVYVVTRMSSGWSPPRLISQRNAWAFVPKWSPDGKLIAWAEDDSAGKGILVVSAADGSEFRVLATAAVLGGDAIVPAWGADNATVYVFVGGGAVGQGSGNLVLSGDQLLGVDKASRIVAVPVAGGPPRRILTETPDGLFSRSEFATDGKRVYFTRGSYEADVWVMDLKR